MSKPFAEYALLLVCSLLAVGARAQDVATEPEVGAGIRYEVALGFNSWNSLADLEPVADGSFDEIGYVFSGAIHWPVRSDTLLLGFDAGLFPSESSIRHVRDELIARGLYLVPSLKWRPAATKRLSLDAGIGYYLVDIAEVVSDYAFYVETEFWQSSALGGFIGGTWNFGSATQSRGLMVAIKTHFFDLGSVNDEDSFLPTRLGPDAGKLSGPVYQLQLGYRWE